MYIVNTIAFFCFAVICHFLQALQRFGAGHRAELNLFQLDDGRQVNGQVFYKSVVPLIFYLKTKQPNR